MTHTTRVYNRRKWRSIVTARADHEVIRDLDARFMSENGPRSWPYFTGTFVYHPYKQVCMGHCHGCKGAYIERAKARARLDQNFFTSEVNEVMHDRKSQIIGQVYEDKAGEKRAYLKIDGKPHTLSIDQLTSLNTMTTKLLEEAKNET